MRGAVPRLVLLFFLSGGAGLIYEVVWARLFADVLGSTALSMTVVFSVFLLALALGSYLFGRLLVHGRAALLLYGGLELGIALSGLAASAVLVLAKSAIAAQLPATDHFGVSLLSAFVVAAALIGAPTLLMGGTLPVIVNAARAWTAPRQVVALLYGWNTLGAACGTLAAGFFLIWHLGLKATLSVAIAVNLSVAVAALLLARHAPSRAVPAEPSESERAPASTRVPEGLLWLALAVLSGFAVLGYEILWGRMAKFLLGDRTIAISALLFVFITCLGLGSLAAPALGRRFGAERSREAVVLIAWALLLAALLHLVFVPLAAATIEGRGLAPIVPIANEFVRRIVLIWLLMLPPVLVLGTAFPLILWSAREIDLLPGRVVGGLYLVNTTAAAAGAAIASFALSRWLGTLGGFLALTGLLAIAAALLILAFSGSRRQKTVAVLAVAAFAVAGYGFPRSLVELRADEDLVVANEDEYGVQVLAHTRRNFMRVRNNRLALIFDLGHPQTTYAQQMAAHLSVLLAAAPRDVLNIGTGYGITAGAFTLYPDIRSVDTVEVLPFMVEQQERFSSHNFDYLHDPRVTLIRADGRHRLAVSGQSYDIISVSVLDPYLPGSASLYTTDFWRLARDRLRPGGVYNQLFWGADVALLVKGLRTVFPTALFFPAYGGTSLIVVAFKEAAREGDLQLHLERLGARAAAEIGRLTRADPGTMLPRLLRQAWRARRGIEDMAAGVAGRLHSDDLPILEYRWAHGVARVSVLDSPLVQY